MSSSLSMNPETPSATAARVETWVPFQAHVKLTPNLATGKRAELIRNLQKASDRAELSITNYLESITDDDVLSISTPVLFTPQFADNSARLTLIGFYKRAEQGNLIPTTDINVIHSGTDPGERTQTYQVNRGGSLSEAQDPTALIETEVVSLRDLLITIFDPLTGNPGIPNFNPKDLIHIEYSGVKFGVKKFGGRSFSQ